MESASVVSIAAAGGFALGVVAANHFTNQNLATSDHDHGKAVANPKRTRLAASRPGDVEILKEQLSRNILFLGEDGQRKVSDSFVIVIGVGGVGSHAAHMLARSGVRRIRLVDFDNVSVSSLNRHAVATRDDVGRSKTEVCADRFRDFAPNCEVEAMEMMFTAETAATILADIPDYVVDCIDDINTKADLLQNCQSRNIKVMSALGAGAKSDPTRILIGELADPVKDPLAMKLRYELRMRAARSRTFSKSTTNTTQLTQSTSSKTSSIDETKSAKGKTTSTSSSTPSTTTISPTSAPTPTPAIPSTIPLTSISTSTPTPSTSTSTSTPSTSTPTSTPTPSTPTPSTKTSTPTPSCDYLRGVHVVYSYEKPSVKLATLDDDQRKNPDGFGAVAGFRLATMPVIGTLPAVFGMMMAGFIICELAGKPFQPKQVEGVTQNFKKKLHSRLIQREREKFSNVEGKKGATPIADVAEITYVIEDVWHTRSAYSDVRSDFKALYLTRFDRSKPALPYNLVMLDKDEIGLHDEQTALTGGLPANLLTTPHVQHAHTKLLEVERVWFEHQTSCDDGGVGDNNNNNKNNNNNNNNNTSNNTNTATIPTTSTTNTTNNGVCDTCGHVGKIDFNLFFTVSTSSVVVVSLLAAVCLYKKTTN